MANKKIVLLIDQAYYTICNGLFFILSIESIFTFKLCFVSIKWEIIKIYLIDFAKLNFKNIQNFFSIIAFLK